MSELLVTCLLCGKGNFTPRGLRAHWCPSKRGKKAFQKNSAPLSREEWERCVNAAKAKAK